MYKWLFCGEPGTLITISEKGVMGINKVTQQRRSTLQAVSGQSIHTDCRRQYTNPTQIQKVINEKDKSMPLHNTGDDAPLLRFSQKSPFRKQCLFIASLQI
jgi:hypothetical protein